MIHLAKNLKFRLLLGLFVFLFVIFYGFGYFLISTLKDSYLQSAKATLGVVIKDISHDYTNQSSADALMGDVKEEFDLQTLYVQLSKWDKKTHAIAHINTSLDLNNKPLQIDTSILTRILEAPNSTLFRTEKHAKGTLLVAHLVLNMQVDMPMILSCAIPYEYHTPYVKALKLWLWMGLGTLLILMLLMVYFIISRSFSSVQRIINEVRSIGIEDSQKRLAKTEVAKEIDNLIDTFNDLISQLQSAYAQVKAFGQNASHELKTPLTIMRGEIEIGLKKERTAEEYQSILSTIHDEVIALQEVIEKILLLSSVTKSDVHASFETLYIDEMLQEVLEEKRALALKQAISLHVSIFEPFTLQANPVLLKIILNNLLDNAIKYSPYGATITIALKEGSLYIENSGQGISEADMPHIFERFYRAKEVRHLVGHGLGLCLVKVILDVHGFRIEVKSIQNKTTSFCIFF